jgi:hypothetical protein
VDKWSKIVLISAKLDKMVEIAITSDYNDNVETFQSSVYGRLTDFFVAKDAKSASKKECFTTIFSPLNK